MPGTSTYPQTADDFPVDRFDSEPERKIGPDVDDHSAAINAVQEVLLALGRGVVDAGSDANTPRPEGFAYYEWYCTVEPVNMADGDTWIDTTP